MALTDYKGMVVSSFEGRVHTAPNLDLEIVLTMGLHTDWETMQERIMYAFSMRGRVRGMSGQMFDNIDIDVYGRGNKALREGLRSLVNIWKEYHLNDLQAGNITQTKILNYTGVEGYSNKCGCLERIGMLDDKGYRYGTGWLCKPIPNSVVEVIKLLIQRMQAISDNL